MEPEILKALVGLPVEVILIFLVIRQQLQIEKLMTAAIESEREHARNLVSIVTHFRGLSDDPATLDGISKIVRN